MVLWMPATVMTPSCAAGITELGRTYVAGIQPQTLVWKPGVRPGRAPQKGRRDAPNTTSVKDLAIGLRAKSVAHHQMAGTARMMAIGRGLRVVRVHVASATSAPGNQQECC